MTPGKKHSPEKRHPQPLIRRGKPQEAITAYRLLIEYDGSRFHGWQKQGERQTAQGIRTVTGALERILQEAGYKPLVLQGSGRTDAGVHAIGQVAHLHLPQGNAPQPKDLQRIFDEGLPSDIAIQRIEPCPPAFHARHDAQARSYLYHLSLRRSAFGKPYLWWVKGRLDQDLLQKAWSLFQGNHDMSAFADLEAGEDARVQIRSCEVIRDGSLLLLRTTAGFFLRRQVRRMVGAAVGCAQGKESLDRLASDIAHPSPEAALYWSGKAAPAAGLFLEKVSYSNETEAPVRPILRVP